MGPGHELYLARPFFECIGQGFPNRKKGMHPRSVYTQWIIAECRFTFHNASAHISRHQSKDRQTRIKTPHGCALCKDDRVSMKPYTQVFDGRYCLHLFVTHGGVGRRYLDFSCLFWKLKQIAMDHSDCFRISKQCLQAILNSCGAFDLFERRACAYNCSASE